MRELLNLLAQNDFIQKERPLDTKDIIDVQKHFVRNELPFLPKMFIDFLKIYNGVKTEGGAVFGIFPMISRLIFWIPTQDTTAQRIKSF